MRTIKFRAQVKWNGNHYFSGDWETGFYVEKSDGKHYIYDTGTDNVGNAIYDFVEIDIKTLGQSTGLHDKNGKEIWEGDIVNNPRNEKGERGEVYQLDTGEWAINWQGTDKGIFPGGNNYRLKVWCDTAEIIGNIYQNPELIK
jgi:uncharacterized phage protein (TIGR01671 family)